MKVALLYTKQSRSEKDLGKMIDHLEGILAETDGVEVESIELDKSPSPLYPTYSHLIYCGFDHLTLASLHLAMNTTDPETTRLTLYDEPGASVERELNALLFRGVDQRRMPANSVTRLTFSWSHRDIVATCKQDVLRYGHGPGSTGKSPSTGSVKPASRSGSRGARAREVESTRAAQAREGDADAVGNRTEPISTGKSEL